MIAVLRAVAVASIVAVGSATIAYARSGDAPASPPHHPKIALVLSGGGALGIAHVGVIQELERMGIRPDLVVGTSMGAIVGGLYSAGYTGDELEQIVTTLDWRGLFDDTPPREGLSFRQKQDQANFPVKGRLRIKDWTLSVPPGVVSDQTLLLALRDLISAKGAVANFDRLPIPFRCVAADIENGKPVVLDSGDLASAIRASFSVPGVLPPVPYNGRLLVDGGIAMNIPVDVAHSMGADILIVVRLNNRLKTKTEIKTAVHVVSQTISLMILLNEQAQIAKMRPSDVLVDVDLTNYTSMSFDRSKELVEPGRKAALAVENKLRSLGHTDGALVAQSPPLAIDFVRITNDTPLDDAVIASRIHVKPGEVLDPKQLNHDLSAIYALGTFERVDYAIVQEAGRTGLEVRALGRQGGYDYVRGAISLETNFDGDASYALSFDYTATALNSLGAEWRVEGVIGDRLRLYSEFFQPLDPEQDWFVMPRVGGEALDIPVYSVAGRKTSEFRTYFGAASLEGGRQFGDWGEVRAGIERGIGHADLKEGFAPIDDVDIDIGSVFVSGGIDTLDQPYFARSGWRGTARWTQALEALGSAQEYQTIEANFGHAMSWGPHTVVILAAGGTTLDGHLPLEALFRLGGPFNLSGYQREELTGEAFARAGLLYSIKLNDAEPRFFDLPIYAGGSLELGNTWADPSDASFDDLIFGGSVFVGADTFLGPAYVGYGRAENDRQQVFLFLGRPF